MNQEAQTSQASAHTLSPYAIESRVPGDKLQTGKFQEKVFPGILQNTLGGSELPSFMQDVNLGIKEECWPL